ncbi:MAG: response regulator [Calditrichales bacterium]|nr:response regulator [Calditrichales bacterium]
MKAMQKILIIDDDPDIRSTLTSILEHEQYEVSSCENAKEAEELLQKDLFSTMLVDIFLPDINGIDFIKNIQGKGVKTPIIIITGSSELNLAREAIRIGVFDYLIKPFKANQLQHVVRNAVLHNHLLEEKEMLEQQKRLYQEELENMVQQKVSELKESEGKYQNLVEQSLVGVYIIQDNLLRYVNKKFCEIFECKADDIINKVGILDFADKKDYQFMKNDLSKRLSGEKTTGNFRAKAVSRSGKKLIVEIWAGLVQYQSKPAIEGIVIDVTDQHNSKLRERKLELELLNEHKLAAIGQLAAGIAHNLNTPIAIIQANAELLKMKYQDEKEIDKVLKQTTRMGDLIKTILTKSKREQETNITSINLNELLRDELEFLNANLYFKHQIEKEYIIDEKLPSFKGVYSDFSQSIMNIIQNSVDAMYKAPVRKLTIVTEADQDFIYLKIADTGFGMSKEVKQKIFDPFFSTKPSRLEPNADKNQPTGTGLGLSLVYNLLSPYGVKIEFISEGNKGTWFLLRVPISNN